MVSLSSELNSQSGHDSEAVLSRFGTRREWRNVLLYGLLLIILTSLPYLLAWSRAGDEWVYSGSLFGREDTYSYLGKMRLGARGIFNFYLFYTPEPHNSAPLIFLPYILPGWIVGRFVSDQDPALIGILTGLFHLMRVMFNALLIGVLYRFIAAFIESPHTRLAALVLATLGGGLGWLLVPAGALPPEFYIPEGFSFLILLGLPHLALARAALLGGFLLLFKAIESPVASRQSSAISQDSSLALITRYSLLSGICWLIVGLSVPFYLSVLYVILATWGLIAWIITHRFPMRLVVNGLLAAGITLPLFLYYAHVFTSNPVFAVWSAQNILRSPNPLHYLLAYGLIVCFAVIGARRMSRQSPVASPKSIALSTRYFLLGWPLIVPLLIYLPMITVQRRLAEAVIVPLAILAAIGLESLADNPRWRRIRFPALVLMCLSSLLLLIIMTLGSLNPSRPQFRPVEEIRALNWLNANAPADSVVLAAYDSGTIDPPHEGDTGNLIPAYTNLRPYVGHGPETVQSSQKDTQVRRFFADQMKADERQALYQSVNIRYIFYGPLERTLRPDATTQPEWVSDGELIYDEDGYQIYQLID